MHTRPRPTRRRRRRSAGSAGLVYRPDRWARALAYRHTVAAVARLSDSARPWIGTRTTASARAREVVARPCASLPNSHAVRTAWLFGNEAHGLATTSLALADAVVRVPIHGRAESLNLATAATVCLYASARAQRSGR